MNALGATPQVKSLAAQALKASAQKPQQSEQRAVEDAYLDRIVADASVTEVEKAVASACRQSTMPKLYPSSACSAHRAALNALAAGVSGPVGQALGRIGAQALRAPYTLEDGRTMSSAWLDAIATRGTPAEALVAGAVRGASAIHLYHSTALSAQRVALESIGAGLKGTDEQALAQVGLQGMRSAYNDEDRRNFAYALLARLPGNAVAVAARAATQPKLYHPSCVHVQRKAFELIAGAPVAPDVALATLGREAVRGAYNVEDGRTMVSAILGQLAVAGRGTAAEGLADAAKSTAAQYLYHSTAAGVMRLACEQISGGLGQQTVEAAIATLGQRAPAVAYNDKDRRTVGSGLLKALAAHTADPRIQGMVRYAEATAGVDDATVLSLQQDVFKTVASGNLSVLSVRLPGTAGNATVAVPLAEPGMDPGAQRASLEASMDHNRDVVRQMAAAEQKAIQEAAAAQARTGDLQARQAELRVRAAAPASKLASALFKALPLFGATAAVGAVAAAGLGSVVAAGVAAAGGVAFIASTALRSRDEAARHRLRAEAGDLEMQVLHLRIELAGHQAVAAAARAGAARAEQALQAADKNLEVFRMADAVNRPLVTDVLKVEDDAVTIGGLRIPRRTAQPPTDDGPLPASEAGTAPGGSTSGGEAALS